MNEDETYSLGDSLKMVDEAEKITKPQNVYPAPFGYKFGHSSVDLSLEENHNIMKDEYDTWWNTKGEQREECRG